VNRHDDRRDIPGGQLNFSFLNVRRNYGSTVDRLNPAAENRRPSGMRLTCGVSSLENPSFFIRPY